MVAVEEPKLPLTCFQTECDETVELQFLFHKNQGQSPAGTWIMFSRFHSSSTELHEEEENMTWTNKIKTSYLQVSDQFVSKTENVKLKFD